MWLKTTVEKYVLILVGLTLTLLLGAQDVPSKPLSIPVYNPMAINPAFVGSKDFTNISLTSKVLNSFDNQIINVHKRLNGPNGVFSKIGIGAYAFQEQLDRSWNTGLAIAGSYHIALDDANIHNISVGSSLKGFFNIPKKEHESVSDTSVSIFNPNMDVGVYYYGPTAFAGLSVTTLFGTSASNEVPVESDAYISREYHFYGGYKFLLNRSNSIVLEPSLLISLDDSTISEPHKQIVPYLKLYLQNFYIGTYVKSLDVFALFFQYQFPRFYTGIFLEFPSTGYLNDDNIIFEVSLGVNLGQGGHEFLQYRHW